MAGTPKAVVWRERTPDALVEQPNSPQLEFGDRVILRRTYRGKYAVCIAAMAPKGSMGGGANTGYFMEGCTVEKERGGIGVLREVWAAGGIDSPGSQLPPDEFACIPVELNPRIETNWRFDGVTAAEVETCMNAVRGATYIERDKEAALIASTGSQQAKDLLEAMQGGAETYYLAGYKYAWVFYAFDAPFLIQGGYIETPGGPLQGYLPNTMDWLRLGDAVTYLNGMYRCERSWLGAPIGHWNPKLYA
jgi:hypothetical protein